MRAHLAVGLVAIAAGTTAGAATGANAAPRPCQDIPQITDPVGDGHHANEDVTAAWFSEEAGRLQAVIRVRTGIWEPAHPDSETAEFAMLFTVSGTVRYVRLAARRGGELRFDHGTWTPAGGFASVGPTSGSITTGSGGTVTIDVPGLAAGTKLASPFALTADGVEGTEPHFVDKAPGGTSPAGDASFGADYGIGSCGAGSYDLTAVSLRAPKSLRGGGRVSVRGAVTPRRAGVPVTLTAGRRSFRTVTDADGRYSVRLPIRVTTLLRAEAEGVRSQSVTVTVRSTVTLELRRKGDTGAVATGRVRPVLPGRVLLLRITASRPSAITRAKNGRFRITLERLRPGRYQAVYIPPGNRAVRSTSKTGVLK